MYFFLARILLRGTKTVHTSCSSHIKIDPLSTSYFSCSKWFKSIPPANKSLGSQHPYSFPVTWQMFKLFNRTSNLVKKLSCKWYNSPDDSTKLNISEKLEGQPFAKCVSYSFDHYQIPDKKQFKGGRVCPQGGRH